MHSRSHPEDSIAQGYLVDECMAFCSSYLHDVESKLNRPIRNYDMERLGKGKGFVLDNTSFVQAHRYVLFNTIPIGPYREQETFSQVF